MEIEIREPRTERDFELYYDLRWRILRQPWGQSRGSARDDREESAIHLMAWSGPKLVGVGRIHPLSAEEGQIRFMAVEREYAHQGVGSCILQHLEQRGLQSGMKRIVLNARNDAVPFYRKHGYRIIEPANRLFESIVQWQMVKYLT